MWIDGCGGFSDNGYSFIGCVLMVVIVVLVVDCGCGCGLMVVVVGAGEDVSEKRKWISTPGVTMPIPSARMMTKRMMMMLFKHEQRSPSHFEALSKA